MTRRIALLVSLLVLGALWTVGPHAQAAGGGGCHLTGTAKFKPGLTVNYGPFTYSFGGKLSDCFSNSSSAPKSGAVSAGQALVFGGVRYQEPVPKGTGACEAGQTSGISIVKWSNGKYTVLKYETNSVTGAVELDATVLKSVRLKAINPGPGQPTSKTIRTTLYGGANSGAVGVLTFQPPDPSLCGSTGVTSAAIDGFTGIGSAS